MKLARKDISVCLCWKSCLWQLTFQPSTSGNCSNATTSRQKLTLSNVQGLAGMSPARLTAFVPSRFVSSLRCEQVLTQAISRCNAADAGAHLRSLRNIVIEDAQHLLTSEHQLIGKLAFDTDAGLKPNWYPKRRLLKVSSKRVYSCNSTAQEGAAGCLYRNTLVPSVIQTQPIIPSHGCHLVPAYLIDQSFQRLTASFVARNSAERKSSSVLSHACSRQILTSLYHGHQMSL